MNIFIGENNLKDYVFLKSIIEKWKEICIGRLSNNEFVEVKRQWLL